MPEYRYETNIFKCSNMGKDVSIESKILVHRSGRNGEVDSERPVQLECDHQEVCDVATVTNSGTSYDWSKCVHPDLKQ